MLRSSLMSPTRAVALLLPALLFACGGGQYGEEPTDPSEDGPGSAPSVTVDMTSSSSGYGSGSDFDFSPQLDTVTVGDTVSWSNSTSNVHTVTADDGSWASGDIVGDGSYSRVFDQVGDHPYYCTHHGRPGSGMHGTIVVVP